jgi:hypothetical protein
MNEPIEPLTLKEISEFLAKTYQQRMCPWCGNCFWGIHFDADAPYPGRAEVRVLHRIHIEKNDKGGLRGSIAYGTESALLAVFVECQECGYLYSFNYFTIMKKVRAQAAEKRNGNVSSD